MTAIARRGTMTHTARVHVWRPVTSIVPGGIRRLSDEAEERRPASRRDTALEKRQRRLDEIGARGCWQGRGGHKPHRDRPDRVAFRVRAVAWVTSVGTATIRAKPAQ